MDEMKRFWVNFVEGRITVPDMLQQTEEKPELLDWLTSIADPKFKTSRVLKETDEGFFSIYTPVDYPFDAKLQIQVYTHGGQGAGSKLGQYLNIHSYFSRVLTTAFPNDGIVVDETLDKKFDFMLEACPDYIGGSEVDFLLDEILDEIPEHLSKTKRVKMYKEKVKSLFHVTGRKFPYWIQEAEWPISPTGKPMRFLEQKRKKGKEYDDTLYTQYFFEDMETGEIRVIDQYT